MSKCTNVQEWNSETLNMNMLNVLCNDKCGVNWIFDSIRFYTCNANMMCDCEKCCFRYFFWVYVSQCVSQSVFRWRWWWNGMQYCRWYKYICVIFNFQFSKIHQYTRKYARNTFTMHHVCVKCMMQIRQPDGTYTHIVQFNHYIVFSVKEFFSPRIYSLKLNLFQSIHKLFISFEQTLQLVSGHIA